MMLQLVFFVLMLFGVAAMAVDLGLAFLTQVQMQNAADSAALEGLRQTSACDPSDTTCIDAARDAASMMAGWSFDADFDLNNDNQDPGNPDPRRIGGGLLEFSGTEQTEMQGLPLFDPNSTQLYRPTLARNSANAASGDLVRGRVCHPESTCDPWTDPAHDELPDYSVRDFTPSTTTDPAANTSFLVRVRRTGVADSTQGETSGPTLPFLFARGTFVHKDDNTTTNPSGYDPRLNGLSVRALSIADSRLAMSVGVPRSGIPGVTNFSVSSSCWGTANPFDPQACAIGSIRGRALSVGQITPAGSSIDPGTNLFLPIFAPESNVVIAYGAVDVPDANTVIKKTGVIASANASAVFRGFDPMLSPADVAAVEAARTAFLGDSGLSAGLLFAPALVR
jgi:hypothetical protein